jgi:hypothetical protein
MQNEWQPIETAPEDGSSFLGYGRTIKGEINQYFIAYYRAGGYTEGWADTFSGTALYLDYWMPLPKPPANNNNEGKMSEKRKFVLKPEHILLLKNAYVGWNDCEFGAPEIDPKRPYGNSSVRLDIAEILGLELFEDAEGEKHLSAEQKKYIDDLHRDTQTALQIVLRNFEIKPGEYHTDKYDYSGTGFKLNNDKDK